MKILDIPFIKHTNVQISHYNDLYLDEQENIKNHMNSIHAGAQFVLAETKSALYLRKLFPQLQNKVVIVLRDSNIKYKKPAIKKIFAYAQSNQENINTFTKQFEKKGRSTIIINVDIKDIDDNLVAKSTFTWYIQSIQE